VYDLNAGHNAGFFAGLNSAIAGCVFFGAGGEHLRAWLPRCIFLGIGEGGYNPRPVPEGIIGVEKWSSVSPETGDDIHPDTGMRH
jgi:hypothetical protein